MSDESLPAIASHPLRSPELHAVPVSRLVIVDVQQRLVPAMNAADRLIARCSRLMSAAQQLEIPIDLTEQYPAGLGPTVEPLQHFGLTPLSKMRFSAAEVLPWATAPDRETRGQIVLAGIETHICILQTAFDLISRGFRVSVVADAVSSRDEADGEFGLKRLRDAGVVVTTSECVLFEWCESAEHPAFAGIRKLVL